MDYHYGAKDERAYEEKLSALGGELDSRSVYLCWYTADLIERMTGLQKGWKYVLDSYLIGRTVEMQDIFQRLEQLMDDKSLKPYFDIDLLENYPDYKFGISQPQQILWLKENYPTLFQKLKEKVAKAH